MYKKVLPSHRLFKRFEERIITGDIELREVVWMGAQIMLQHAVEIEMSAFLDRGYYQNAPAVTARNGRRNGYEKHTVLIADLTHPSQPTVRGEDAAAALERLNHHGSDGSLGDGGYGRIRDDVSNLLRAA